jgi:hypothetical protein
MVSIYSKPYTSLPINLNGVYNGLPFVLNSNKIDAPNFKYICEVFFNNQKVTELRHHPDISNSRKGVFDVGRIVENYMTFNQNVLEKFASYAGNDSVSFYHCQFGEEHSRLVQFSTSTNAGGKLRLYSKWGLNIDLNDWFYVQGSTIPSYNGWKKIIFKSGSTITTLDTPYSGGPDLERLYAYQGTNVNGFISVDINGSYYLGLKIPLPVGTNPVIYKKGDRVLIDSPQTPNNLNSYYKNTEWTVTQDPYTSSGFLIVPLNARYMFSIGSLVQGVVMSKDNFVFKNQTTTFADKSYAWTGVRQYENEFLLPNSNRSDDQWQFFYRKSETSPTPLVYMKTFSDKPTKVVSICPGETYQIQSMGSWLNKVGSLDNRKETHIRVETWGTDTSTNTGGVIQSNTGIAFVGSSLTYKKTGDIRSQFGVGDYVTITVNGFGGYTKNCRIVSTSFVGGFTFIYTDGVSTGLGDGTGSIVSTIRVRYYDVLLQSGSQVIPCGPWNLSVLSGVTNWVVYKYFVYPIVPTTGIYFTPNGGISTDTDNNGTNYVGNRKLCGEKWEFNIDFSCCNDNVDTYKIMWLNKKGGFDFYKFTKRTDRKFNIERSEFDRKLPNIQSTNNIYGYKSGQRGTTNYNVKSRETLILNSDFLSQPDLDWLINIYESPEVYLVKETKQTVASGTIGIPYLVPVSVIKDEVIQPNKRFRNDDGSSLYTYQLEVQMANDRVLQRGGGDGVRYYIKSLYE